MRSGIMKPQNLRVSLLLLVLLTLSYTMANKNSNPSNTTNTNATNSSASSLVPSGALWATVPLTLALSFTALQQAAFQ
ncbi:hypothetical protein AGOR_G00029620 [Albula goreensis]|uniref:Uncharacterized protein n=1 Tax=Albula goreensis TaxID=1534307 RepID=A0A8T3E352_9TELE|nr:hypothetical protein AGOR_G00029620 [Albula goreensis]